MATLHLLKNPLSARDIEQLPIEPGTRIIDWLVDNYPSGCDGAVKLYVNGDELDLDFAEYVVQPDDRIVVAIYPCFPLGPIGIAIAISLAVSLVMTAVSIGITLLLKKPDPPAFSKPDHAEPSPVYSVRNSQNTARLGEPVSVVYGTVMHTPDICAQPYKFYGDNHSDEYLDMLLCLGAGDFDIGPFYIGDTRVSDIEGGIVGIQTYDRSQHGGVMGNIFPTFGGTRYFRENMYTAPEVGSQEFINYGEEVGWFRLGKAGQSGRIIEVDIHYPQGLFQMMDQGDITTTQCGAYLVIQECDSNGNRNPATEIIFDCNSSTQGISGDWSRNPLRQTFAHDTGRQGLWAAKLIRHTNREPNGNETNRFVWTSLRMVIDVPGVGSGAYGNVTLAAVRLKATALAEASQDQVRVELHRRLKVQGTGALVATGDPADVFCDMLMNLDYGARRSVGEIDIPRLSALRNYWAPSGHDIYKFNGVYTGKTTIWDALAQVLVLFGAAPLPLGGYMSVMQDGVKSTRTMLFTEQNIVQDTFKLMYSFDEVGAPDGIEVEYRDPITFAPVYVRQPSNSVDPEKIQLFGCTNAQHAAEFALLQWQRRTHNRRTVIFETEMEGLIPGLGDRIAVQHTLPRWGMSGFVVGVLDDRRRITLDRNLKYSEITGPYVMVFRDNMGGLSNKVTATRDGADNKVLLSADPWNGLSTDWSLTLGEEITHFAWGNDQVMVKDFLLTNIAPKGNGRVSLEGVAYDSTVFGGTMHFIQTEVPY